MRTDFDQDAARKAMLREGIAMLAHGVMLPFGFLKSAHKPLRKKDIRTLVFVHGYAATRANFFPMQVYLRLSGYKRQYSFNFPSKGSIEAMAVNLKQQLDSNIKGGRIDLIGHSMGGLVARYYLQELGGARRVDRLITLGTPHRGTYASAYVPSTLADQMRPDGPFITHLNELDPPRNVDCWSFAGGRDLLVLPRESGVCPFGEGRTFDGLGHMTMLMSPECLASVRTALGSPLQVDSAERLGR